MSMSLVALYQWVLDNLHCNPYSNDWHSLAEATILATGSSIPCYSKTLAPPSALRCCVSHLHRVLVNDKFPGWHEMGKWNFVSRVEDGDESANRIIYEALKGCFIKTSCKGKGGKEAAGKIMSGYNHNELMETMIERERDMEIALKGFRGRGYGVGSPEVRQAGEGDSAPTITIFSHHARRSRSLNRNRPRNPTLTLSDGQRESAGRERLRGR